VSVPERFGLPGRTTVVTASAGADIAIVDILDPLAHETAEAIAASTRRPACAYRRRFRTRVDAVHCIGVNPKPPRSTFFPRNGRR
jgi:hypothetical protein